MEEQILSKATIGAAELNELQDKIFLEDALETSVEIVAMLRQRGLSKEQMAYLLRALVRFIGN